MTLVGVRPVRPGSTYVRGRSNVVRRGFVILCLAVIGLGVVGTLRAERVLARPLSPSHKTHGTHSRLSRQTIVQTILLKQDATAGSDWFSASSASAVRSALVKKGEPSRKTTQSKPASVRLSIGVGFYGQSRQSALVPLRITARNRTGRTISGELTI